MKKLRDIYLMVENLQQADKIYFKTGKLSPMVRKIMIDKVTGGDAYTKRMCDFFYALNQDGHRSGDWAIHYMDNPGGDFVPKDHYESEEDWKDIETWKKVKNLYKELKEYNKNVFPTPDYEPNDKRSILRFINTLKYRRSILDIFNTFPSIAKRNMKKDIRQVRNQEQMMKYLSDLQYFEGLVSQLNNRDESVKQTILKKMFKSDTTLEELINFADEKQNLIGGTEMTKDVVKQIIDEHHIDIVHSKGDKLVLEVYDMEAIRAIGCNSVWCFTYNRKGGGLNYQDWGSYSTNDTVYVFIDFSVPSDDPTFMYVLIEPLNFFPQNEEDEVENDEKLYSMSNESVWNPLAVISEFMDLDKARRTLTFDMEPQPKPKEPKVKDPNQLQLQFESKLNQIYKSILLENQINELMIILEKEIMVGDTLTDKLQQVDNSLAKKILSFLNSDKIKDVNVDYVDYNPENQQLLTVGFTDQQGNQRTRNVKLMKLLKYLGAETHTIKGYEVEELISHLQQGDTSNFKIVRGEQLRAAYHCKNHDESETENMGSCMRYTEAQPYFDMLVDNPNQVGMLVLLNPKNGKIRGRALIWNLDDGNTLIDRIYTVNNEYKKDFNSYIQQHGLTTKVTDDVTLDNGGTYEQYPYLDTLYYYTPETGVLSASYGDIQLQGQDGQDSTGIYSEILDERIPEDEAVFIKHLEDYVYDHQAEEGVDGNYVYMKDPNAREIDKGSKAGFWAINSEETGVQWVQDWKDDIIWAEESYYLEAGDYEDNYAHERDVVQDYFDRTILRQEAIKATMGSAKGERIFYEDALVFTSGPYSGQVFHEQDTGEDFIQGEYEYVDNVIDRDDFWLYEPENKLPENTMKLTNIFKQLLSEELSYRHTNTEGEEDDEYEIGMVKSEVMNEEIDINQFRFNDGRFNKNGANTIYMDDNPIVDFGVGEIGQVEVYGKVFDNAIFLKGGFNASEQKRGYGTIALEVIFRKLPKIQYLILECLDSAKGFWSKMGGQVVGQRPYVKNNPKSPTLYTMVISRGDFLGA